MRFSPTRGGWGRGHVEAKSGQVADGRVAPAPAATTARAPGRRGRGGPGGKPGRGDSPRHPPEVGGHGLGALEGGQEEDDPSLPVHDEGAGGMLDGE
jgi:hypothetical protein